MLLDKKNLGFIKLGSEKLQSGFNQSLIIRPKMSCSEMKMVGLITMRKLYVSIFLHESTRQLLLESPFRMHYCYTRIIEIDKILTKSHTISITCR